VEEFCHFLSNEKLQYHLQNRSSLDPPNKSSSHLHIEHLRVDLPCEIWIPK
jgi:hypothetical protein